MSEVVKTIARRNSNSTGQLFETPIPIGTDGAYVQMKSKLDLEEELKLGGNKVTVVRLKQKKENGVTYKYYQIIEWYANKNITLRSNLPQKENSQGEYSQSGNRNYITHTIETNIYTDGTYEVSNISVGDATIQDILVERENVNDGENPIVVIDNISLAEYKTIIITNIFGRYMSYNDLDNSTTASTKILHQKTIQMKPVSLNSQDNYNLTDG